MCRVGKGIMRRGGGEFGGQVGDRSREVGIGDRARGVFFGREKSRVWCSSIALLFLEILCDSSVSTRGENEGGGN